MRHRINGVTDKSNKVWKSKLYREKLLPL